MNKIPPQTLKGFRDFLPQEARKRQYVINALKSVFELYGFEPLETPVLELGEVLSGKYGDEGEQLMYRFRDRGERNVAMRYDQTVPLARVIAQYQNELPMPFKRYQIQPVWRAENTQKGRYREFLQCDADIVGTNSSDADQEITNLALDCLIKLNFDPTKIKIKLNNRTIFDMLVKYIASLSENHAFIENTTNIGIAVRELASSIDKLEKIEKAGVLKEIENKKYLKENLLKTQKEFQKLIDFLELKPSNSVSEIINYFSDYFPKPELDWLDKLEDYNKKNEHVTITPALSRGLNYYTGVIFEIEVAGYTAGSVCGGGRYDNLIGMFTDKQIPATGFAFGFDRLIEAMEILNLFPADLANSSTQVLVTVFSQELKQKSLEITTALREQNTNTEIYLGEIKEKKPLEKQLKYADQKGIPYVVIVGPEEAEKAIVTVKNLRTREQNQITIEELLKKFRIENV